MYSLREQILADKIELWRDSLFIQFKDIKEMIKDYLGDDSNLEISENIYGWINKENTLDSFGVYEKWKPAMLIFTISKNFALIWDIHLKYIEDHLLWKVQDFLKMVSHIYFVGVCNVDISDFERLWKWIELLKDKEESKLRSIICTPNERKGSYFSNSIPPTKQYSEKVLKLRGSHKVTRKLEIQGLRSIICTPNERKGSYFSNSIPPTKQYSEKVLKLRGSHKVTFYPLNQNAIEVLSIIFRWYEDWTSKITFILEEFELKDISNLEFLFKSICNNSIKFFNCRLYISSYFSEPYWDLRNSNVFFTKWKILDENGYPSIDAKSKLIIGLLKSSFRLKNIFFQKCIEAKENILDYLLLTKENELLYSYILLRTRDIEDSIEHIDKFTLKLKVMNCNIILHSPSFEMMDCTKIIKNMFWSFHKVSNKNIFSTLNKILILKIKWYISWLLK